VWARPGDETCSSSFQDVRRHAARVVVSCTPLCQNPPHCVADIVSKLGGCCFCREQANWPTARFFVGTEEPVTTSWAMPLRFPSANGTYTTL
jgi:hypothetical protein